MVRRHAGLLVVLVAVVLLAARFLEWFPYGWDQAEYCTCLKADYLPHSPYLLYFAAGKLLHLVFPPPLALSELSALAALAAVALFYGAHLRLWRRSLGRLGLSEGEGRAAAVLAAALLGLCFAFIRQAATQEVYTCQAALALLALFVLLGEGRRRAVWSGVAFGAAVATHNASLLLVPAFLVALWARGSFRRDGLRWALAAAVVCAVAAGALFALVPGKPGEGRASYVAGYLRGSSPRALHGALAEPRFLAHSLRGMYRRLFTQDVAMCRLARAAAPLGTSPMHLVAALAGLALCARLGLWPGLLWAVYTLPFLAHEVALGRNLDYGLYVPFVLPPLASLSAVAVAAMGRLRGLQWGRRFLQAFAALALLLPSGVLAWRHWDAVERGAGEHFGRTTLVAAWAADHLPPDAVLLAPADEPNVNLVPYYAERRHAYLSGGAWMLFVPRGPFTPLNLSSFEPLTTERLRELLEAGHTVWAFEPQPLARAEPGRLDPAAFAWGQPRLVRLEEAAASLALPPSVRERLPGGTALLYRCRLAGGQAAGEP
ncbi:MAG: hypothetical protein ACLF0G_16910 [Candidatus Brocadiia bacterium]